MRQRIGPLVGILSLLLLGAQGGTPSFAQDRVFQLAVFGDGALLGVRLADFEHDDLARLKLDRERGALVKKVVPDSPAEKAGLQADDVILKFGDEAVISAAQLARLVRETPPGRKVALEVSRAGAIMKIDVALGERDEKGGRFTLPHPDPDFDIELPDWLTSGPERFRHRIEPWVSRRHAPRKLGIEYQEISGQLAQYFQVNDGGILIMSVDEGGPAQRAGVRAGDVLLRVKGDLVRTSDDLREAVAEIKPGEDVLLTIQREGRPMEIKLKAAGEDDSKTERPRGLKT